MLFLFRAAYTAGRLSWLSCAWAVLAILNIFTCSPVDVSGAGRLGLRARASRVAFKDRRWDLGTGCGWIWIRSIID